MRANGLTLGQIADELYTNEQVVKNVCHRARRRWTPEGEATITQDRFLALAIVAGRIVWDPSVGKFVPEDELL